MLRVKEELHHYENLYTPADTTKAKMVPTSSTNGHHGERGTPKSRLSPAHHAILLENSVSAQSWAKAVKFCKQYRCWIWATVGIFLGVSLGYLMSWSHTCVQQNDRILSTNYEILSRLPNTTIEQQIDAYERKLGTVYEELEKTKKNISELQEKLQFIERAACTDLGSIGNPIVLCDYESCMGNRLNGKEKPFHVIGNISAINYSQTKFFPEDCLDVAITEISCFSDRGEFPVMRERKRLNCPGKKQFQCLSSGRHDNYYGHDTHRDVFAMYRTCTIIQS